MTGMRKRLIFGLGSLWVFVGASNLVEATTFVPLTFNQQVANATFICPGDLSGKHSETVNGVTSTVFNFKISEACAKGNLAVGQVVRIFIPGGTDTRPQSNGRINVTRGIGVPNLKENQRYILSLRGSAEPYALSSWDHNGIIEMKKDTANKWVIENRTHIFESADKINSTTSGKQKKATLVPATPTTPGKSVTSYQDFKNKVRAAQQP